MANPAYENRASTGIAGLDEVLGGGLPRNHLYAIQGTTGAGKTTLGLQFVLEGARAGERALYLSFAERRADLEQIAASHGWSLEGVVIQEMGPTAEELELTEGYTLFHPSEVESGEALQAILAAMEQARPDRVVLDTFSGLRLLAEDPLRTRRQIQALERAIVRQPCTLLILDEYSEHTPLQANTQFWGILQLQREPRGYGRDHHWLQVVKLRASAFVSGAHDCEIVTGGLVVYPRLVAGEHVTEFPDESVPSGVAEFDTLLGGGLTRGTTTLFLGPTGSGKSVVSTRFALAAAERGEKVAIYVFEESLKTYFTRATGLGMDLGEQVRAGRISVQRIAPAELSPGQFAWELQQRIERDGVRMVLIDSLSGYFKAMPHEAFAELHLHALFSYLNGRGVTTLTTLIQHGVVGVDLAAPLDVSYLSDTVVLHRFFEAMGEIRLALSVTKKRAGNHERTIRELHLGPQGVRLGPPLTEFQGVLSGIPTYTGTAGPLLDHGL